MNEEGLGKFNPVDETTRLIRARLSNWGWSESDWDLAQELINNHAAVLKETQTEIRYTPGRGKPRQWSGSFDDGLQESIQHFGTVFETRPNWEAREKESQEDYLHLLVWADPKIPSPPRDYFGSAIKSLTYANDPSEFVARTYNLHQMVPGKVVVIVEGKERSKIAVNLLNSTPAGRPKGRIFFIGIAASPEEAYRIQQSLSSQLQESPEQLIGVVLKGRGEKQLHANILGILEKTFAPSESGTPSVPK